MVSWEQTDGEYREKSEHRMAVAYVANANTTPQVTFGPVTDSPPGNRTSLDLCTNVALADHGVRVDVFWMHIDEPRPGDVTLSLMHRVDLATEGAAAPAE